MTVEEYVEINSGHPILNALSIMMAKSECEAIVTEFMDEQGELYDEDSEWPPRRFIELCREIAEFEVPAPSVKES